MDVALRFVFDQQALVEHRRQVRSASDEGDVVAGLRQPATVEAADPARAHDRDFHVVVTEAYNGRDGTITRPRPRGRGRTVDSRAASTAPLTGAARRR